MVKVTQEKQPPTEQARLKRPDVSQEQETCLNPTQTLQEMRLQEMRLQEMRLALQCGPRISAKNSFPDNLLLDTRVRAALAAIGKEVDAAKVKKDPSQSS